MIKEAAHRAIENPKAQVVGATWTTGFGLGTMLNYIPDILGVIATLMGLALTGVMISKGLIDRKKSKLEVKIMEKEITCEECLRNRRGS